MPSRSPPLGPEDSDGKPLHGRRVIVVEDEALIAMMVEDVLRAEGAEVVVTHDGRAAMAAFAGQEFDAAVVNLGLPDLHGAEVIGHFRGFRPSLPVLISTGSIAALGGGRPASLPGDAATVVMEKPFDPAMLAEAIVNIVTGDRGSRR